VSTSSVSILIRGLLIASAAATAVPVLAKDEGRGNSSKFAALAQCGVSEQGRMPFLSGRNHFRGSMRGSSYGQVFFAGGAGNRVKDSSRDESSDRGGRASSPAATAGPGGAGGTAGAGGGGTAGSGTTPGAGASAGQDSGTAGPIGGVTGVWSGAGTTASGSGPVPSPNPEPASLLLIGTGLGGLLVLRRRARWTKP
jgi:hypothetical protein